MHGEEMLLDLPGRQFEKWTAQERTVKKRYQIVKFEDTGEWLGLPTKIHITLAWNWFIGRFPDRTFL